MGQFSVENSDLPGSDLNGNQHRWPIMCGIMGNFVIQTTLNTGAKPVETTIPGGGSFTDVEDALLTALANMAVHSHRRQADLDVAVLRAGLIAGPDRLRIALRRLQDDGCVERVVPLADGGVLVSVTGRGIERLSQGPRSG